MFKGSRWRGDKHRIIAVFKFQFHATQVSEYGGNGMVISVVPADNGKPTAKLEKCVISENCCYWENPVCETVKFIHDPKSGKIHEKIYYFIVSTGSPKGSLVGEFSVNIADYLEATKACSISFPFKKSISNSHLHVSIERLHESDNQSHLGKSEVEEKSLRQYFSESDVQEDVKTNYIGDAPLRKTVSHMPGLSSTNRGSNGSDITLSSSDSSSGLNTPTGLGPRHNNGNTDEPSNGSTNHDQQKTRWDLAIVPVNGSNTDFSLNSPRDVFSSDRSLIGLDESVDKLKSDIVALSRRAEVSEIELQTLRKQIVKEGKKGQDLLKEVASLKEERDSLKYECEKLKSSRRFTDELGEDPWILIEKIQEELNHEKHLNTDLRVQVQKMQESNAELLLTVQDLEETSRKNDRVSNGGVGKSDDSILNCLSDDEEQRALEEIVKQHRDAQETYLLEQKVMDLCSELEMYRRDKDELEMQMEQLALDYEILKQENHEFSTKLEMSYHMKMQYDPSSSYAAIVELEAQREKLQHELSEQSRELSHCLACKEELEKQVDECKGEKEAVVGSYMEQKERADQAEAALGESEATVNKLEVEVKKLKTDLKKQLQELSRCFTAMHELETQRHNLEGELSRQAREFQADIEDLSRAKMEFERRAFEAEEAVACSKATIEELNRNITKLENELKTHSEESSVNMMKIEKLEAYVHELEDEMDRQVEGFETDLEAVTQAKVEQEKRAIRAEEALRLVKCKNASIATRIQDEFRRLTLEMGTTFKSNEKLAIRALSESRELRVENCHLRDMLQKANEKLHSARHHYDPKIRELNDRIDVKSVELECIVVEFEEKCKYFESEIRHIDEVQESVFLRYMELRDEKERDLYVVDENMEGNILEGGDVPIKEGVKDEMGHVTLDMCSEVDILRSQTTSKTTKSESVQRGSNEEKVSEEVTKASVVPEVSICYEYFNNVDSCNEDQNFDKLLKEMILLKERNNSMELELKEMQERYSDMSVKFAEVEGERQKLVMALRNVKNAKKS